MRAITTTAALVLFISFCSAQSYEGSCEYQKKDERAIVMEVPYPPSIVEDAIAGRLEKLGCKKREAKGYLVYKNTILNEVSAEAADYVIRVERKSRKDKDECVIYFLVNRNNENIIARNDALVNSNAKTFINGLTPHIEAYNLEMQIKDQEEIIGKAEKKLKGLQDDQDDMEKKIKKLQDDLKDNDKDQQDQVKEIERLKGVLDAMKGRRKA